ncbi:hypothetical protein XENTR_v10007420 [Xenopus tropicalis]|nr:hypothetical protein XENTR_v10007420 [Xenopus tropicalis]
MSLEYLNDNPISGFQIMSSFTRVLESGIELYTFLCNMAEPVERKKLNPGNGSEPPC